MDLLQLRIFISAAALKSFSRAAEQLYMSQPNVSSRIKALEEELETILFDRSRSRELSLTEEGRIFLDYAQSMINLEEETRNALKQQDRVAGGLIRVGASTVPGTYLLPPLLAAFRRSHPDVSYSLTVLDTDAVLEGVVAYSFDMGCVGNRNRDERLIFHSLAEDELVLAAPPGALPKETEGSNGRISIESCLAQPLLTRETGSATRLLLKNALHTRGLTFEDFASVIYVNSLEAIKQGVRYGLGVAFLSRCSVADYLQMGLIEVYHVTDLVLTRSFNLVYRRQRILSRAALHLADYIKGGKSAANCGRFGQ